jgi:hypothetical protein
METKLENGWNLKNKKINKWKRINLKMGNEMGIGNIIGTMENYFGKAHLKMEKKKAIGRNIISVESYFPKVHIKMETELVNGWNLKNKKNKKMQQLNKISVKGNNVSFDLAISFPKTLTPSAIITCSDDLIDSLMSLKNDGYSLTGEFIFPDGTTNIRNL